MTIEAISTISAEATSNVGELADSAPAPFSQRLAAEFVSVNEKMAVAEGNLRDLAAGQAGNLHHVMLSLEDARLSFQLLVQVRNKVLDAYQELMRMQV